MARTWINGSGVALSAANLNALEADVTTALGVPDAALAGRVVGGATKTALDARYATNTALSGKEPAIAAGTTAQYIRGDKSLATLDKNAVGLSAVDNTSDINKPVSLATQAALNNIVAGEAQIWAGWRRGVANMSTKTLEWYAIGDSNTEGTGVTAYTDCWLYRAGTKLRANYASVAGNAKNSRGYTPIVQTSTTMVSPWTITGTNTTTSTHGLRRTKSVQLTGAGATITGTVTGTAIDVWYAQGTATGAFTVKIDAGTPVSVGGSSGATTDGFSTRVSMGASGSHTVTITRGASDCYINGITVYDGNESSGLVTLNGGWHGANTNSWSNSAGATTYVQNITTLDPELVTIMLTTNDYSFNLGRAAFSTNIKTIVGYVRDNCAGWPTILLISPWKSNATYVPAWEHYQYGLERAAAEIGCAYFDLRTKMPDVGSAADTQGYYADTTHMLAAGQENVATEIANLLIQKAT